MSYLEYPIEIQEDLYDENAGSYCVGSSPADRCRAIQRLVRPDEVESLVGYLSPGPAMAGRVGALMAALLPPQGPLSLFADPPGCDRWSSPSSTFRRRGGDCDDMAILALSLLIAAGCDSASVAVGFVWTGQKWEGHAWVEGHDERGWFRLEATNGRVDRRRGSSYVLELLLTPDLSDSPFPLVY